MMRPSRGLLYPWRALLYPGGAFLYLWAVARFPATGRQYVSSNASTTSGLHQTWPSRGLAISLDEAYSILDEAWSISGLLPGFRLPVGST